jgi:peroxiredoxin
VATEPYEINEGASAPDFALQSTNGPVRLSDLRGKQVVLYFMRSFSCNVCQQHVARLQRQYPALQQRNTEVLVIGPDSQAEANKLQRRMKLPFPVIADTEGVAYGSYTLNKTLGILQHSASFLIDSAGTVRYARRSTLPMGSLNEVDLIAAVSKHASSKH